jgi:hypothetical protein
MKTIILVLFIFIISVDCLAQNNLNNKSENVSEVIKILGKLNEIAEKYISDQTQVKDQSNDAFDERLKVLQKTVKYEIDKIKTIEQLILIARMSYAVLYKQDIENSAFDRVFDIAFWECVNRLATDTNEDAINGLRLIKRSGLVEGDIGAINQAIQKQQKLKQKKGK